MNFPPNFSVVDVQLVLSRLAAEKRTGFRGFRVAVGRGWGKNGLTCWGLAGLV